MIFTITTQCCCCAKFFIGPEEFMCLCAQRWQLLGRFFEGPEWEESRNVVYPRNTRGDNHVKVRKSKTLSKRCVIANLFFFFWQLQNCTQKNYLFFHKKVLIKIISSCKLITEAKKPFIVQVTQFESFAIELSNLLENYFKLTK